LPVATWFFDPQCGREAGGILVALSAWPSITKKDEPVILEVSEAGKAVVVLKGSANTWFRFMIQPPDGRYGLLVEDLPGENNAWMIDNF
jgi:hypothetical protein